MFQNQAALFLETSADAVYLSRFGHNVVFYSQNKAGYQLPGRKGFRHQTFTVINLATDARGDYFNNLMELGPGYRVGFDRLKNLQVYVAFLRGVYTAQGRRLHNDLRGPNFNDIRLSLWYSHSF